MGTIVRAQTFDERLKTEVFYGFMVMEKKEKENLSHLFQA